MSCLTSISLNAAHLCNGDNTTTCSLVIRKTGENVDEKNSSVPHTSSALTAVTWVGMEVRGLIRVLLKYTTCFLSGNFGAPEVCYDEALSAIPTCLMASLGRLLWLKMAKDTVVVNFLVSRKLNDNGQRQVNAGRSNPQLVHVQKPEISAPRLS